MAASTMPVGALSHSVGTPLIKAEVPALPAAPVRAIIYPRNYHPDQNMEMYCTALKTDGVAQARLGAVASNTVEVLSDVAGLVRNLDNTIVGSLLHNADATSPNYQQVGTLTTNGVVTGGIKFLDGRNQRKKAIEIGDTAGQRLAELKMADGVGSFGGAGCFVPVRVIHLTHDASARLISSAALTAANKCMSSGLFIFSFAGLALAESSRRQKNEASDVLEQVKLYDYQTNDQDAKDCLQALRNRVGDKNIRADGVHGVEESEKYKRVIGDPGLVDEIFESDVNTPPERARELVQQVHQAASNSYKTNALLCVLAVLCVAAWVTMALSGLGLPIAFGILMAANVISVVTSAGFLYVDGCGLYQAFKNGKAGKGDKLVMFVATVLMTIGIVTAMFVGGALSLTNPVMWITVGLGLIWLIVTATCIARMRRGYPVIDQLVQALTQKHYRYAEKLYHQLSKEEQDRIGLKLWDEFGSSEHLKMLRSLYPDKKEEEIKLDFGRDYFMAHRKDAAILAAVKASKK
jgi:hypothetical protein